MAPDTSRLCSLSAVIVSRIMSGSDVQLFIVHLQTLSKKLHALRLHSSPHIRKRCLFCFCFLNDTLTVFERVIHFFYVMHHIFHGLLFLRKFLVYLYTCN